MILAEPVQLCGTCTLATSRRARRPISASARRSSAASGPKPSRQRVRSPALPACSSAAAAAPTPAAPTVCAAPLSLCAAAASVGRSPAREAASISRSASIAVSRNFASSELIAAVVVAEPGGEHVAVDRGGRLRRVLGASARASPSVDRQPALERGAQLVDVHRLGQIGIHAGREAALLLALHGIGRDRDDRRARARAALGLGGADLARQLVAVHARHVDVGEHRGVAPVRRAQASSASTPSLAVSAAMPSRSSWRTSTSRFTGWSSTTRMRGAPCERPAPSRRASSAGGAQRRVERRIGRRGLQRQRHREGRAVARACSRPRRRRPSAAARRRTIERPRPVPPKRRVVEESACANGWNRRARCSSSSPMPVSRDRERHPRPAVAERGGAGVHARCRRAR